MPSSPWRYRVHTANDQLPNDQGSFVHYVCRVNRRSEANHALAWAAHTANQHQDHCWGSNWKAYRQWLRHKPRHE